MQTGFEKNRGLVSILNTELLFTSMYLYKLGFSLVTAIKWNIDINWSRFRFWVIVLKVWNTTYIIMDLFSQSDSLKCIKINNCKLST